jgi:hypothetical protein
MEQGSTKYGVVIYLKMLDTNLKNTLRVVLFMNEETEIEVVLNTEN